MALLLNIQKPPGIFSYRVGEQVVKTVLNLEFRIENQVMGSDQGVKAVLNLELKTKTIINLATGLSASYKARTGKGE